jgi:hypothetical protein
MFIPEDCSRTIFEKHFIVKYPASKKQDENYRHFRSVVYKHDGTLVCMSPSKSIPYEDFKKQFTIEQCIVEDFVEGTMINVFFDEEWHIATKSNVGAMCTFESSITFAGMFHDCMNYHQLTYESLDTNTSYSFVMQHPANRIVTSFAHPRLYLVAMYSYPVLEHLASFFEPQRYTVSSYEEVERLAQYGMMKGLVLKCNGYRTKIRNETHSSIEKLRFNSTFDYRYLCLRNKPELHTYLSYFPEDTYRSMVYEESIKKCASDLYIMYKECFVFKKAPLKTYDERSILYELHGIYLNELKPTSMSFTRIMHYLDTMPPAKLICLLRRRK